MLRQDAYNGAQKHGNDERIVAGRLLLVAAQNDTVDKMFHDARRIYNAYTTAIKRPPPLIIRLHSKVLEYAAVSAMWDPRWR